MGPFVGAEIRWAGPLTQCRSQTKIPNANRVPFSQRSSPIETVPGGTTMQKKISTLSILSFFLVLLSVAMENPRANGPALSAPPKTATTEVKEIVQGTEIVDPYRWLEDQNSPETRTWINAQNAYTDAALAKIQGREEIKRRVSALLKIDAMGTPSVQSDRYFFAKRQADQDQFILYLRKGLQGKDEVLVDPLSMSAEHT